jgi:2-dehydropantoate 2-reductase
MKICVFGAGAIGGNVAARLASSGADVSVIARGEHLAAMRSNGITLEMPKETITAKVKASADARELGPQDLVLVAVKAPALPDVAAGIAPLLKADTPVVFVMNGIPWWYFYKHGGKLDGHRLPRIDPDDVVWNAIGPERAVGGVVNSSNSIVRPGVIRNTSGRAHLVIGEPSGELSRRVKQIADAINASTATATVSAHIRDDVWTKLLANLSSNMLTLLSQSALGPVIGDPACNAAVKTIAKEGAAIARALGCDVSMDVDQAFSATSVHKPSIVQDLERGRPLELDAMFTVPAEFARMTGVATPMLDLMLALTVLRAKNAGLYK